MRVENKTHLEKHADSSGVLLLIRRRLLVRRTVETGEYGRPARGRAVVRPEDAAVPPHVREEGIGEEGAAVSGRDRVRSHRIRDLETAEDVHAEDAVGLFVRVPVGDPGAEALYCVRGPSGQDGSRINWLGRLFLRPADEVIVAARVVHLLKPVVEVWTDFLEVFQYGRRHRFGVLPLPARLRPHEGRVRPEREEGYACIWRDVP